MTKRAERLKLPDDFEGTLRALLQTPPPPKRQRAKRQAAKKRRAGKPAKD
jgi:hypothetical protein